MAIQQILIKGQRYKPFLKQKTTSRGIPVSFFNRVMNDSESFVKGLRGNTNITDYQSFLKEFAKHLDKSASGKSAKDWFYQDLDQELLRVVFRSKIIRNALEQNIGKAEADKIYAQEEQTTIPSIIPPPAIPTPPTIAPARTMTVGEHRRGTITIKQYIRKPAQKFTNSQRRFLQVRRQKGMTLKSVLAEYRKAFSMDTRSDVAISTKLYRQK